MSERRKNTVVRLEDFVKRRRSASPSSPPSEELHAQLRQIEKEIAEGMARLRNAAAHATRGGEIAAVEAHFQQIAHRLRELERKASRSSRQGERLTSSLFRRVGEMISTRLHPAQGEDFEIDDFGLDADFRRSLEPFFSFLYERYWRVEASGISNIPIQGPAMFVANHSGLLPYDALLISLAVELEHPNPRPVRFLIEDIFSAAPFLGPFLTRIGMVRACQENGEMLLRRGHLIGVFPEGIKGISKRYRQRYRMQRFGRGGFIRLAIKTKVPIVPVAVVGLEEVHPIVARADLIGRPFGFPFTPITPTFPLLGPLGLLPLPSRCFIHFGEPIDLSTEGEGIIEDDIEINKRKEMVRARIQEMIYDGLKRRKSIWFG
ncbi:MAG: glycerol acyltransferase [Deltaproteobacteria bacterium]|nr:MAG: glycerol acyltransferase [Deltaproteobacteria bacterium]